MVGIFSSVTFLRNQGSGPSLFFIQSAPIHWPLQSAAESGPTVNDAGSLHGDSAPSLSHTRTFHQHRDPFTSGVPI